MIDRSKLRVFFQLLFYLAAVMLAANARPPGGLANLHAASAASARTMAIQLPPGQQYETRKDCMTAVKTSSALAFGLGVRIHSSNSGSKAVEVRCGSAITTVTSVNGDGKQSRGKTHWAAEDIPGFKCTQREGEKNHAFKIRRKQELSLFADGVVCPFVVEAKKAKDGQWYCKDQGNGLNYVPHSESCTCIAKATGSVLVGLMQPAIKADVDMTGEKAWDALAGVEGLSKGMLPTKSALYRAKQHIQHISDAWYAEDWARLSQHFSTFFKRMGHALCAKHLAAAARHHVKQLRVKGNKTANPSFHDNMVINIAKASSKEEKYRAEKVRSFGLSLSPCS
jgi:hypothetical protein